jgi:hypothetical protein
LKVNDKPSTKNDQGYVSSAAWSPTLDSWIGLGMLKRGRERHGERIMLWDGLRDVHIEAEVCNPGVHRSGRGEDPCLTVFAPVSPLAHVMPLAAMAGHCRKAPA